jgi:hypothetical protein
MGQRHSTYCHVLRTNKKADLFMMPTKREWSPSTD